MTASIQPLSYQTRQEISKKLLEWSKTIQDLSEGLQELNVHRHAENADFPTSPMTADDFNALSAENSPQDIGPTPAQDHTVPIVMPHQRATKCETVPNTPTAEMPFLHEI